MSCLQETDFKYKIIGTLKEKDRKRYIMKTHQKEPEEPEEINLPCTIVSHSSCVPYLFKPSIEFFIS